MPNVLDLSLFPCKSQGWVGGGVGGWGVGGVTKRKPKKRETDKSCRL